jgi:hypothetical protein
MIDSKCLLTVDFPISLVATNSGRTSTVVTPTFGKMLPKIG